MEVGSGCYRFIGCCTRCVMDCATEGIWDGILPSLLAPIVLAVINVTIRPVLLFITFPITALTLGLFIFVINGFSIWLTAKLVPGFTVIGMWAFLLTIAISIIGWASI